MKTHLYIQGGSGTWCSYSFKLVFIFVYWKSQVLYFFILSSKLENGTNSLKNCSIILSSKSSTKNLSTKPQIYVQDTCFRCVCVCMRVRVCVCVFFGLHLHLQHMEFPWLRVQLELQLPAYTTATATPELSLTCDLQCSSPKCLPEWSQGSNLCPHGY